ncbi:MAG: TetR/AcrR family transcriptional regulator [Myxococcota bacterium]
MLNETTRARQKAATAAAVLEAARDEFERAGFEGANLRAIAARAGVTAGTVLHHFGDKKELLHAALFDELDRTLRAALERPGAGPLTAQLSRLGQAVFKSYQARPTLSRTLLRESLFADPPWAQRFAAQAGEVHAALVLLVKAAAERGEVPPTLDAPLFAVAWLSFFYFALISWVQGAHERPLALVDRLVAQHLGANPTTPRRRR